MVNGANRKGFSLYGGSDPADLPRYSRVDAARATGVPASTIGVWLRGMPYSTKRGKKFYEPVIELPDNDDPRLSFNNILEVSVLRALRLPPHDVELKCVRTAIDRAKTQLNIPRLLIDPRVRSSAGELFLDYYFQLVELSKSQQLAMRSILEHTLKRVEIDEDLRYSFFPMPRYMSPEARPILVSPYVSFGSAIIERRGISTYAIRSRLDSGESPDNIKADYDLRDDEFQEAILYEAAA